MKDNLDQWRKNRKQENKEQECTEVETVTLAESGGKIAHHPFWGALWINTIKLWCDQPWTEPNQNLEVL